MATGRATGRATRRATGPKHVSRALAAALGLTACVFLAPWANAGPECTDVGVSTRICNRGPGHIAITTTPNPAFTNPGAGWGFGTLGMPVFGVAGGGIWLGF
jgi:hypothetical protein